MQQTIHWLGAGLSSTPGIRRLAQGDAPFIVWNLDRGQTIAALAAAGVTTEVREFEFPVLRDAVAAGDVVVSMLPATMHLDVARLCLDRDAHFVSSSYVSPDMLALQGEVLEKRLCFVNEVGLDPGIDHLFTHLLVERYRAAAHPDDRLCFRSYCGGFPRHANDFRYKFSWSPLGTLLALTAPVRWIEDGREQRSARPWKAVKPVSVTGCDEVFQAYPNRDSLPFVEQYGFDPGWRIEEFVRGTLRLDGWVQAWKQVLAQVDAADPSRAATELGALAESLGKQYSYDPGEPDRVVLSVELEARRGDVPTWHGWYLIDTCGDERGSAMARLVSQPVSLAADSVLAGDFAPGVQAATADPRLIETWLSALELLGERIVRG